MVALPAELVAVASKVNVLVATEVTGEVIESVEVAGGTGGYVARDGVTGSESLDGPWLLAFKGVSFKGVTRN